MFRAAHRSSLGALTVFAASGLHTHVVTGRSQAVCRSKHVELLTFWHRGLKFKFLAHPVCKM
jgi:hypothetical protein